VNTSIQLVTVKRTKVQLVGLALALHLLKWENFICKRSKRLQLFGVKRERLHGGYKIYNCSLYPVGYKTIASNTRSIQGNSKTLAAVNF